MRDELRRSEGSRSGRGHGLSASGGQAVGNQVRLPRGAESPIRVYINGVEQAEGDDYRREGSLITFREPILKEGKLGPLRWLSMWIGLVGTYRKHETVDIEYRLRGKPQLASDVEVLAVERGEGA